MFPFMRGSSNARRAAAAQEQDRRQIELETAAALERDGKITADYLQTVPWRMAYNDKPISVYRCVTHGRMTRHQSESGDSLNVDGRPVRGWEDAAEKLNVPLIQHSR